MDFDEKRKKAFDFCADAVKQLITLATFIITITITFSKDFVIDVSDTAKYWAYGAWLVYLFSIIFGMLALLALTAELEPKPPKSSASAPSIRGAAATWSFLQIISFAIAMSLTIFFAIIAVNKPILKHTKNSEKISKIDTGSVKSDSHNCIINKK